MAATPLASATVMLVRDGASGIEVFMVVRHHAIDFAKGALVFPGGKVDEADADAALHARCRGLAGLDDAAAALRIAAIREAFEEAGLLLAYARGGGPIDGARVAALGGRYRQELIASTSGLKAMVEGEELELDAGALVPFAHWVTPESSPRRFDTHFFIAAAPAGQMLSHDGGESVDSLWISPNTALADADAGRRTVVFATRQNLGKLARSTSIADALERARREPVVTVRPDVTRVAGGVRIRIPPEAGYDQSETFLARPEPGHENA